MRPRTTASLLWRALGTASGGFLVGIGLALVPAVIVLALGRGTELAGILLILGAAAGAAASALVPPGRLGPAVRGAVTGFLVGSLWSFLPFGLPDLVVPGAAAVAGALAFARLMDGVQVMCAGAAAAAVGSMGRLLLALAESDVEFDEAYDGLGAVVAILGSLVLIPAAALARRNPGLRRGLAALALVPPTALHLWVCSHEPRMAPGLLLDAAAIYALHHANARQDADEWA